MPIYLWVCFFLSLLLHSRFIFAHCIARFKLTTKEAQKGATSPRKRSNINHFWWIRNNQKRWIISAEYKRIKETVWCVHFIYIYSVHNWIWKAMLMWWARYSPRGFKWISCHCWQQQQRSPLTCLLLLLLKIGNDKKFASNSFSRRAHGCVSGESEH